MELGCDKYFRFVWLRVSEISILILRWSMLHRCLLLRLPVVFLSERPIRCFLVLWCFRSCFWNL